MTDEDIKKWAEGIVDTRFTRKEVIQGLLNHSKTDEMTADDKLACIRAIQLIESGDLYDHPPFVIDRALRSRLSLPDGLDGAEQVEEP